MHTRRAVRALRIVVVAVCSAAAAACSPMVHVTTEADPPVADDPGLPVAVNLRLRTDALELAITNRGESPVDILWDRASLVDTDGRSSGIVHSRTGDQWLAPDRGGDVSRIGPHSTLAVFVVPARDVVFDSYSGWYVDALLPVECGPVRCIGYHELVGKTVRLTLPLRVDGAEQIVERTLRITDSEKSVRGARPEEAKLY